METKLTTAIKKQVKLDVRLKNKRIVPEIKLKIRTARNHFLPEISSSLQR